MMGTHLEKVQTWEMEQKMVCGEQWQELVKAEKIDAYEVNGREVVLYWRQIKAEAKKELSLSLTAAVPGTYTAPASRVYEYYTDEFKTWATPLSVTIKPADERRGWWGR